MGWFVKSILGLPKLETQGCSYCRTIQARLERSRASQQRPGAYSLRSLLGCCLWDFSFFPPRNLAFSLPSLPGRGKEKLQAPEAAGK